MVQPNHLTRPRAARSSTTASRPRASAAARALPPATRCTCTCSHAQATNARRHQLSTPVARLRPPGSGHRPRPPGSGHRLRPPGSGHPARAIDSGRHSPAPRRRPPAHHVLGGDRGARDGAEGLHPPRPRRRRCGARAHRGPRRADALRHLPARRHQCAARPPVPTTLHRRALSTHTPAHAMRTTSRLSAMGEAGQLTKSAVRKCKLLCVPPGAEGLTPPEVNNRKLDQYARLLYCLCA